MRIVVTGNCDAAKNLRSLLHKAGFVIGESGLGLTHIIIDENDKEKDVIVDGVDGELERRVVEHIGDRVDRVVLKRKGGVQSAFRLHITTPKQLSEAVEIGCLRGLIAFNTNRSWWKLW